MVHSTGRCEVRTATKHKERLAHQILPKAMFKCSTLDTGRKPKAVELEITVNKQFANIPMVMRLVLDGQQPSVAHSAQSL